MPALALWLLCTLLITERCLSLRRALGDAGTLATLDMNRKTNTRLIQTLFCFPSFPPSQRGGVGGEALPGPPPSSNSLAVPHITIGFFWVFFLLHLWEIAQKASNSKGKVVFAWLKLLRGAQKIWAPEEVE